MAAPATFHLDDGKRFSHRRISSKCERVPDRRAALVTAASSKYRCATAQELDGTRSRGERADMDVFIRRWRTAIPPDCRFGHLRGCWDRLDKCIGARSV